MNNKLNFLNKGISTPVGILIILVCSLIAGGVFLWQLGQWPKEEIKIPTDETTNWSTYRNEEYGFEVNYPKDWILDEKSDDLVYFDSPSTKEKVIEVEKTGGSYEINPHAITIQFTISDKTAEELSVLVGPLGKRLGTIYFGDNQGIQTLEQGIADSEWVRTYIDHGSGVLIIDGTNEPEIIKTYNLILSTFKFIESISMTYWQTYRNEKYMFEVKYPKDYKTIDGLKGLTILLDRGSVGVQEIDNSIRSIDLPEDCVFNSNALEEKNMLSFVDTKEINRITFYYYKNYPEYIVDYCGMSGGCWYKDIYNTFYKGNCYQVEYIRSDRVSLGEYDYWRYATEEEMKVPEVFDQILSTFKFIEVEDETADWSIYRNEEYGFEVRHPNNWEIKEESYVAKDTFYVAFDIVGYRPSDTEAYHRWYPLTIEVHDQAILAGKSIEEWIESREAVDFKVDIIETKTLNNKKAVIVESDAALIGIGHEATILSRGYLYRIYITNSQDIANDTKVALDKILSTFKFIEIQETSQDLKVDQLKLFNFNIDNPNFRKGEFPDYGYYIAKSYYQDYQEGELPIVIGDLNGDNKKDAIVLIVQGSGGSAVGVLMAALISDNGMPKLSDITPLGDRSYIELMKIESGIITIDLWVKGPDDPGCCPSVKKVRKYTLEGGKLISSDWQTYKNEEYGFRVKYPEYWSTEGNQDSVYFKRIDISQEEIEEKQIGYPLSILIENTSAVSILDWFENKFSDKAQDLRPEKKLMTIGGINGINYSDSVSMGGCEETFAIIKNGKLFRFLRHGSTCNYSDKLFTIILSTFKFLE